MVVEVNLLGFVYRLGGGERASGVIGFRCQVLMFDLILPLRQFRGLPRRVRLGLVHSGLEVFHGYVGHLVLQFRRHFRR